MTTIPQIRRGWAPYIQVADHYKRKIATGEIPSGAQLPSVRDIAKEWGVSPNTAHRAVGHLASAGLVRVAPGQRALVNGDRVKLGPQERLAGQSYPPSERVEVRAAELIKAPEYVIPLLGLEPGADGITRVIRREQVSYERGDRPFMLSVSWFRPEFGDAVPELLAAEPVPSAGGAARLIEERTGRTIHRGRQAREARIIYDDGREGPLLGLEPGSACLGETYLWWGGDPEDVLEYGEYVLILNRVTENDFEVGPEAE